MKTLTKQTALLFLVFFFLLFISCKTTDSYEAVELDLIPINSVEVEGYSVQLFSFKNLEVGSNDLFWQVEKDNSLVEIRNITVTPRMHNGEMMHTCPSDDPAMYQENRSYQHNQTIFTEAGSDMNPWFLHFDLTTKTNQHLVGSLTVDVAPSWRIKMLTAPSQNVYYVTWDQPKVPVLGINWLEFIVHKETDTNSYTQVSSATLTIKPFINAVGGAHTPKYVDPISFSDGTYKGYIDFDVAGTWKTNLKLAFDGDTLTSTDFEYDVLEK